MVVCSINGRDDYYQATTRLSNGAIANGFGSTMISAINNCIDDMYSITDIQYSE